MFRDIETRLRVGAWCILLPIWLHYGRGLIKVFSPLEQLGLIWCQPPGDRNNHSACGKDLSQGARELSPFPAHPVRTLPDSHETLLNLSPTGAVVSRKNSLVHNLMTAASRTHRFRFGLAH